MTKPLAPCTDSDFHYYLAKRAAAATLAGTVGFFILGVFDMWLGQVFGWFIVVIAALALIGVILADREHSKVYSHPPMRHRR